VGGLRWQLLLLVLLLLRLHMLQSLWQGHLGGERHVGGVHLVPLL
jgi:hypothetical protein